MTTIKVLIEGVGDYSAGDIIKDAPAGLVHIAESQIKNAATGELVAEIVDNATEDKDELAELRAKAKELGVPKYSKMNRDELTAAIDAQGAHTDGE
ncbi:Rho termination factor N-terminal domain-containing protein [Paenibacillus sp. UMB4589-SE434]|uniref:Rho termination factor N-terminal domain-containing protein n=1 Tax=Paenibacillus sp. UMB4589-SE434 TaxID=3046314 RepID=UPI002549EA44|nr:Rho termination factor N-terminal domain-containing protein [Paenibacillus sp. UMB4589-SE434]MDK8182108.1 Rho termination factor N-terminal domain-containing protein [Paenibacillus sp. UMB4589-SE434]